MKKLSKSRIIDLGLLVFVILILAIPELRLSVMSSLQSVLLRTGLFNATVSQGVTNELFTSSFVLKDTAGQRVELADLRGKVVFVNVWATWCPPCLAEMPEIAELYKELGQQVEFLMISVDKNHQKAQQWIQEEGFAVPVYFPQQRSLDYATIPTTWVIDRSGKMVFKKTGMAQYNTPHFKEFLRSL
ncbi:MAG: TlpA disulfide reductase family protein [Bacteroidota bacterium]